MASHIDAANDAINASTPQNTPHTSLLDLEQVKSTWIQQKEQGVDPSEATSLLLSELLYHQHHSRSIPLFPSVSILLHEIFSRHSSPELYTSFVRQVMQRYPRSESYSMLGKLRFIQILGAATMGSLKSVAINPEDDLLSQLSGDARTGLLQCVGDVLRASSAPNVRQSLRTSMYYNLSVLFLASPALATEMIKTGKPPGRTFAQSSAVLGPFIGVLAYTNSYWTRGPARLAGAPVRSELVKATTKPAVFQWYLAEVINVTNVAPSDTVKLFADYISTLGSNDITLASGVEPSLSNPDLFGSILKVLRIRPGVAVPTLVQFFQDLPRGVLTMEQLHTLYDPLILNELRNNDSKRQEEASKLCQALHPHVVNLDAIASISLLYTNTLLGGQGQPTLTNAVAKTTIIETLSHWLTTLNTILPQLQRTNISSTSAQCQDVVTSSSQQVIMAFDTLLQKESNSAVKQAIYTAITTYTSASRVVPPQYIDMVKSLLIASGSALHSLEGMNKSLPLLFSIANMCVDCLSTQLRSTSPQSGTVSALPVYIQSLCDELNTASAKQQLLTTFAFSADKPSLHLAALASLLLYVCIQRFSAPDEALPAEVLNTLKPNGFLSTVDWIHDSASAVEDEKKTQRASDVFELLQRSPATRQNAYLAAFFYALLTHAQSPVSRRAIQDTSTTATVLDSILDRQGFHFSGLYKSLVLAMLSNNTASAQYIHAEITFILKQLSNPEKSYEVLLLLAIQQLFDDVDTAGGIHAYITTHVSDKAQTRLAAPSLSTATNDISEFTASHLRSSSVEQIAFSRRLFAALQSIAHPDIITSPTAVVVSLALAAHPYLHTPRQGTVKAHQHNYYLSNQFNSIITLYQSLCPAGVNSGTTTVLNSEVSLHLGQLLTTPEATALIQAIYVSRPLSSWLFKSLAGQGSSVAAPADPNATHLVAQLDRYTIKHEHFIPCISSPYIVATAVFSGFFSGVCPEAFHRVLYGGIQRNLVQPARHLLATLFEYHCQVFSTQPGKPSGVDEPRDTAKTPPEPPTHTSQGADISKMTPDAQIVYFESNIRHNIDNALAFIGASSIVFDYIVHTSIKYSRDHLLSGIYTPLIEFVTGKTTNKQEIASKNNFTLTIFRPVTMPLIQSLTKCLDLHIGEDESVVSLLRSAIQIIMTASGFINQICLHNDNIDLTAGQKEAHHKDGLDKLYTVFQCLHRLYDATQGAAVSSTTMLFILPLYEVFVQQIELIVRFINGEQGTYGFAADAEITENTKKLPQPTTASGRVIDDADDDDAEDDDETSGVLSLIDNSSTRYERDTAEAAFVAALSLVGKTLSSHAAVISTSIPSTSIDKGSPQVNARVVNDGSPAYPIRRVLHVYLGLLNGLSSTSNVTTSCLSHIPSRCSFDAASFFEDITAALGRIATSFTIADFTVIVSNEALFSMNAATRYASLLACDRIRFLGQIPEFLAHHEAALQDASEEAPINLTRPVRQIFNLIQEFNVHISTLCFDRNDAVAQCAKRLSQLFNLEEMSSRAGLVLSSPRLVQQAGQQTKGEVIQSPFDVLLSKQLSLLSHPSNGIRHAAAASLSHIISVFSTSEHPLILSTLQRLQVLFTQFKDVVIRAQNSRETDRLVSHAEKRIAVAKALSHLTPLLELPQCQSDAQGQSFYDLVREFITAVVSSMLAELDISVWESVVQAAVGLIHTYSSDPRVVSDLTQYLLSSLPGEKAGKSQQHDDPLQQARHEGIVVLLSSVSRYIPATENDTLKSITTALVESSQTSSSDSVHHAIGACLSALVKHLDDDYIDQLYSSLFTKCIENRASTDVVRMACAVCLVAIVRAKGGVYFQKQQLMAKAIEALKSTSTKQFSSNYGALCIIYQLFLAFQHTNFMCLYVKQIIPLLLPCFGAEHKVREIARDVSDILMKTASTSMQGASKVILPLLLVGLRDKTWKNKVFSLEMIASIVSFSSKDLSLSLPVILPRLIELRRDANPDVAESAGKVLSSLASVIRNPEIRRIAPTIIDALSDTNTNTISAALDDVYTTVFMHYIDPISLALTIPLVIYGLKERGSNVKKIAVQVSGSVTMIIENNDDISPYIEDLLSLMKVALMDSIPDVRKVTGKAIGTMVKTATETKNITNIQHFEDLLQLLFDILSQKDVIIPVGTDIPCYASNGTTSVQRSGAALGLSHIIFYHGGIEAVERYYDTLILTELANRNAAIREGYLQLLYHLPVAFGQQFKPLVCKSLPVIVGMLNDSNAFCREYAQKASQEIVILFATSLTDEILATILESLLDTDYRVRTGSSILAASFLLRLCGLSGEITIAEAEDQAATGVQTAIRERNAITTPQQEGLMLDYMSVENKHELYSSLYLLRTDPVHSVSAVAWRVWKAITPSTTRTLASILPRLVERITMDLASFSEQRQLTAGRALSELISKLGDRILRDVIPILLDKVSSLDVYTRSGVCLGFKEIFESATKAMLSPYIVDIFPTIHLFLCDSEEMVRDAGCSAFISLARAIGPDRTTKEIVPALLTTIDTEHDIYLQAIESRKVSDDVDDSEPLVDKSAYALAGLRGIIAQGYVQKACLDYVIPFWIRSPISQFYVTCIASVTDVCGKSFHNYLENVIRSLYNALLQNYHIVYIKYGEHADDEEEGTSLTYDDEGDVIIPQEYINQEQELLTSAKHVFAGLAESHAYSILEILVSGLSSSEYTTLDEQLTSLKLIELYFHALAKYGDRIDLDEFGTLWNQTITALVEFFTSDNDHILTFSGNALHALLSVQHYDNLIKHLGFIRTQINLVTGKHSKRGIRSINELTILENTKLLQQILAITQHGIVSAPPLLRGQCAALLADVIELTPANTLSAHAMKVTGFLIRTFVDKLTVEIRASILLSLSFLIKKSSAILRPFQTQLKSMLLKTINTEESEILCERAAYTLAALARPETFLGELVASVDRHASTAIGGKLLRAAVSIFTEHPESHGEHITEALYTDLVKKLVPYLGLITANDSVRIEASRLIGIVLRHVPTEDAAEIVSSLLSDCGVSSTSSSHYILRQSVAMVLSCVLIHSADIFMEVVGYKNAISFIARGFKDDNELACTAAIRFSGRLLLFANKNSDEQIMKMLTQELLALCQPARNNSADVIVCALQQVRALAEYDPYIMSELVNIVVPLCIRTRTGAARSIRKECDILMAYALGFNESEETGMETATELSEKFDKADSVEFLQLCKRSISKALDKSSKDDDEDTNNQF